jgi:hypothetical protein
MEQAKDAAGNIHVPGRINKSKCFTLLVIDDANTDWSVLSPTTSSVYTNNEIVSRDVV